MLRDFLSPNSSTFKWICCCKRHKIVQTFHPLTIHIDKGFGSTESVKVHELSGDTSQYHCLMVLVERDTFSERNRQNHSILAKMYTLILLLYVISVKVKFALTPLF